MTSSDPDQPPGKGSRQRRSRAEWISFAISAAILSTVVGLILYLWAKERQQTPPHLLVSPATEVRKQAGQFYYPFSVTNEGDRTAEAVHVVAELLVDGVVVEEGVQSFEFVSNDEVRKGAFVFSRDPNQGEVVMRVTGYKLP
ncbi:MAG: TIGR02588 family protein [Cyanobacteria bacterium P01_A01_bin.135]